MLKALLKKQFLELKAFYFQRKGKKQPKTKFGKAGFLLLIILLIFSICASFYMLCSLFAESFIPSGYTWLYFAFMGIAAMFMGVIGSVFNTYAGLYHAKDNDLLLSMPIKSSYILFARMVSLYVVTVVFEAFIFLPAILAFFVYGTPTVFSIINCLLLIPFLGFLSLAISSFLGWIIALVASKIKHKSFVTVTMSLIFIAVYYYFCGNMYGTVQSLIAKADALSAAFKSYIFPVYLFGKAAEGDILCLLMYVAFVGAIFGLAYFILSKTFIKITSHHESGTKIEYKEKPMKQTGLDSALFKRELRRFSASPTYILNCSLSTFFMTAGGIAVLVFKEKITATLGILPIPKDVILVMATAAVCLMSGMNCITAPSISLEGKNVWILQSMPIDANAVFNAKKKLHYALTIPPAAFMMLSLAFVLGADIPTMCSMVCITFIYVMFMAAVGLAINLKSPNMEWPNETIPVKQSVGVLVSMLGGMVLGGLIGFGGYMLYTKISVQTYLYGVLIVLALGSRLINGWIFKNGPALFKNL